MASSVEHEMDTCLTEMDKLKAKMAELQETKKSKDLENERKIQDIEPNMEVMKNWLDLYSLNEQHILRTQTYHNLSAQKKDSIPKQAPCKSSARDDKESSNLIPEPVKPFSDIIIKCSRGHITKQIHQPSDFMKNFIEATHNLFQIQQKRIDELEAKLLTKVD